MWTPDAFLARQVRQQRNRLNGFAQSHLVGQDTVEPVFVHRRQPVQSDVLVLSQCVTQQERHRCLYLTNDSNNS